MPVTPRPGALRGMGLAAFVAVLVAVLVAAIVVAPPAVAGPAADSIRYAVATTDVNRVGVAISNYAFFGNNFNSRSPSFEYPLGSGFDHLFQGWYKSIRCDREQYLLPC